MLVFEQLFSFLKHAVPLITAVKSYMIQALGSPRPSKQVGLSAKKNYKQPP
jgi:hypothetical protein